MLKTKQDILKKKIGGRQWGESLPGRAYPAVEGPGNPSWERRNPPKAPNRPKPVNPMPGRKAYGPLPGKASTPGQRPVTPMPNPKPNFPVRPGGPKPTPPGKIGGPYKPSPVRPVSPGQRPVTPMPNPKAEWNDGDKWKKRKIVGKALTNAQRTGVKKTDY